MDRRRMIVGATGAALAAGASTATAQPQADYVYDYLFLTLKEGSGAAGRRALMAFLAERSRGAVTAAGGELLGAFTPQLGWESQDTAVLLRWNRNSPERERVVAGLQSGPGLAGSLRYRLAATARPQPSDRPQPGGIYVHRWFEILARDQDEFVRLSQEGWLDFEKRFATHIFGLFAEEPERARSRAVRRRLLLLTRYADHGVWEASRDPTTDAMKSFQRRQQLTLSSKAASSLLATLPNP